MEIIDSVNKLVILKTQKNQSVEQILLELNSKFFYYNKKITKILNSDNTIKKDSEIINESVVYITNLLTILCYKDQIRIFSPKIMYSKWKHYKKFFDISEKEFESFLEIIKHRNKPEIKVATIKVKLNVDLDHVYSEIKDSVTGLFLNSKKQGLIKIDPKWKNVIVVNWKLGCEIFINKTEIKFQFKTIPVTIDDIAFDVFTFCALFSDDIKSYSQLEIVGVTAGITIKSIDNDLIQIKKNIQNSYNQFYDYNIFTDSLQIIPKQKDIFKKIIFYNDSTIRFDIKFENYSDLFKIFDFFVNNVFVNLKLSFDNFKLKSNSTDCQKSRQVDIVFGTKKQIHEKQLLPFLKMVCNPDSDHYFPGFTKKGTPCCFKKSNHSQLQFLLFGNSFFEPKGEFNFTSKELESQKQKVNIYIIETDFLNTKDYSFQLQNSDYPYDIYPLNSFYLWDQFTNQIWILKLKNGDTKFKETFGFKLNFNIYSGIFYYKDFMNKKITGQVLDSRNNVYFIEFKGKGLIPIKSQPKIEGLPEIPLKQYPIETQTKLLKDLKLIFTETTNFILIKDSFIRIPKTEKGVKELLEINKLLLI